MDSISRYHLSKHENGTWNVVERSTGGPVEVWDRTHYRLLCKLPKGEAEGWSRLLNDRSQRLSRNNSTR